MTLAGGYLLWHLERIFGAIVIYRIIFTVQIWIAADDMTSTKNDGREPWDRNWFPQPEKDPNFPVTAKRIHWLPKMDRGRRHGNERGCLTRSSVIAFYTGTQMPKRDFRTVYDNVWRADFVPSVPVLLLKTMVPRIHPPLYYAFCRVSRVSIVPSLVKKMPGIFLKFTWNSRFSQNLLLLATL